MISPLAILGVAGFMALSVPANAVHADDGAGKFYNDYSSQADTTKAGGELTKDIAAEGNVLLKNDGVLPLSGVKRVTAFGKNTNASIFTGLENAGFIVNHTVKDFYSDSSRSGAGLTMQRGRNVPITGDKINIGELTLDQLDAACLSSLDYYNDAAIMTVYRQSGEGLDVPFLGVKDNAQQEGPGRNYNEISVNEEALIKELEKRFDKVVVLLNTPGVMELRGFEDSEAHPNLAILWIGGSLGDRGADGTAEILSGAVNPSGHTVDTWYKDFSKDPTYQNFANNEQHTDDHSELVRFLNPDGSEIIKGADNKLVNASGTFVEYKEGIYLGYRYYETAAYEASKGNYAGFVYEDQVNYPFGYGLSYTTFKKTIKANGLINENKSYYVDVEVENTGDVAGKEVVQVYVEAPYESGKIEKAHVVLQGFEKTRLLKPGEKQVVRVQFDVQDLASYDADDANENGHKGYELDAGHYFIRVQDDAHDWGDDNLLKIDFELGVTQNFDTDKVTGAKVENRFDKGTEYSSVPSGEIDDLKVMSRADFAGTFPAFPTVADRTIKADWTYDWYGEEVSLLHVLENNFNYDDLEYAWGGKENPRKVTAADMEGLTQADSAQGRTITLKFKDMLGVAYDDPKWDELINQLTLEELLNFIGAGYRTTYAIPAIEKPEAYRDDGPNRLNTINWNSQPTIAATYNKDLAKKMGILTGDDAMWVNKVCWWAPGCDIHRNPNEGRINEYYSEDGFLSGKMAAAVVAGAKSRGLYVQFKHFALNEQETYRHGIATYANEQSIREIYLKGFQLGVQEGGANGVMSAFNRIGIHDAASNYALCVEILRNEWGFQGIVSTDAYVDVTAPLDSLAPNGNDCPLWTQPASDYGLSWDATQHAPVYKARNGETKVSYSGWKAVRNACHNALFADAQSFIMKNGLDVSVFQGKDLSGALGLKFEQSIAADISGVGTKNVKYLVSSGSLPDGLSLSVGGVISGTPSKVGTFRFKIAMVADNWVEKESSFSMTVKPFLDVLDYNAEVGQEFEQVVTSDVLEHYRDGAYLNGTNMFGGPSAPTIEAFYGEFPEKYKHYYYVGFELTLAPEQQLPDGLEIDRETRKITGVPEVAGDYTFEVTMICEYLIVDPGASGCRPGYDSYTGEITIHVAEEGAGGSAQPVEDPNAAAIAALQAEIATLKTQVAGNSQLSAKVAALETQVASLSNYNDADLKAKISALEAEIAALKESQGSAQGNGCGSSIESVSVITLASLLAFALISVVAVKGLRRKEEK